MRLKLIVPRPARSDSSEMLQQARIYIRMRLVMSKQKAGRLEKQMFRKHNWEFAVTFGIIHPCTQECQLHVVNLGKFQVKLYSMKYCGMVPFKSTQS